MGGGSHGSSPRLLDLIPKKEWKGGGGERRGFGVEEGEEEEEERKLELTLWPTTTQEGGGGDGREHPSVLSLGLFGRPSRLSTANHSVGTKRGFLELENPEDVNSDGFQRQHQQQQKGGSHHHYEADGMMGKEQQYHHHLLSHEKNQACPHAAAAAPATAGTAGNAGAVAHNKPQSRTTSVPVVGWPPVRSFRKNITSAPKPSQELIEPKKPEKIESSTKGLFLKINMDGIPIGRKIDLKAYKSYESLSAAVDELFRGFLAAQRESDFSNEGSAKESLPITGLLDGSGEYTLVYEDSDGDRILVGDVPWEMFVSTAKRLRVLKTSQLSTLHLGAANKERASPASGGVL